MLHGMTVKMNILRLFGLRTEREYQELRDSLRSYLKHQTLNTFKQWLHENLEQTPIKYKFDDHAEREMHYVLEFPDILTTAYYKFCTKILAGKEITTPDKLIFYLNIAINKHINGKYRTDMEAWGKEEYWENPIEAYRVLVDQKKGLDCDSVALFKYHCLRVMFKSFGWWSEHKWRLKCIVTDIMGYGRHLCLTWVKSGINDNIVLESTFFPNEFERIWNENLTINNNYLYKIINSFDEDTEYRRINGLKIN